MLTVLPFYLIFSLSRCYGMTALCIEYSKFCVGYASFLLYYMGDVLHRVRKISPVIYGRHFV